MFAIEIDFHDGTSPREVILIRRPHAVVGNSDFAHVVVDNTGRNLCELRVSRGLGREFRCQPLKSNGENQARLPFVPGVYSGTAELDLGGITARILTLDCDLTLRPNEDPGAAGLRVLRQAVTESAPLFPAVALLGKSPLYMSFQRGDSVLIGRSRTCSFRLDAADVSSEHARIGIDEESFWIEDLNSTNGTFIQGERIRGKRTVRAGEPIQIGSEIQLACVGSAEDVARLTARVEREVNSDKQGFPLIVASSEFIQPSQLMLQRGQKITIGRDPANDIWIPAGHVSRTHAELRLTEDGEVELTDVSSNGVYLKGDRIPRRLPLPLPNELSVIDFRRGAKLAVCFSREDQLTFSSGREPEGEESETVSEINTILDDATRTFDRNQLLQAMGPVLERLDRAEGEKQSGPGEGERLKEAAAMLNPATGKVRSAQIEEGATVGERVAVESIRREPQSKGSALQEGRVTSAPRKNPLERGFNTPPSRVRDEESWDRSERVQERRDIRKRTLVNGQFPSIANGGFQSRIAPQGVVTIAGRAIGIKVFVVALIVGVVFGALGGVFLYSALNRETGLGVEEDISSSISPSRSAGLGE